MARANIESSILYNREVIYTQIKTLDENKMSRFKLKVFEEKIQYTVKLMYYSTIFWIVLSKHISSNNFQFESIEVKLDIVNRGNVL